MNHIEQCGSLAGCLEGALDVSSLLPSATVSVRSMVGGTADALLSVNATGALAVAAVAVVAAVVAAVVVDVGGFEYSKHFGFT